MNILTSNSSFNVSALVQSKKVESRELPNFFGWSNSKKQELVEDSHDVQILNLKEDNE